MRIIDREREREKICHRAREREREKNVCQREREERQGKRKRDSDRLDTDAQPSLGECVRLNCTTESVCLFEQQKPSFSHRPLQLRASMETQ